MELQKIKLAKLDSLKNYWEIDFVCGHKTIDTETSVHNKLYPQTENFCCQCWIVKMKAEKVSRRIKLQNLQKALNGEY